MHYITVCMYLLDKFIDFSKKYTLPKLIVTRNSLDKIYILYYFGIRSESRNCNKELRVLLRKMIPICDGKASVIVERNYFFLAWEASKKKFEEDLLLCCTISARTTRFL